MANQSKLEILAERFLEDAGAARPGRRGALRRPAHGRDTGVQVPVAPVPVGQGLRAHDHREQGVNSIEHFLA